MEDVVIKGQPRKGSKIAARVRRITTVLLITILAVIVISATLMVQDVASKASQKLAYFYSLESVHVFNSFIIRDLALVQKVASSRAVTEWFADEGNEEKKIAAFNEMMDYKSLLGSAELYFVIDESLNEFSIRYNSLADFAPFDVISPDDPYDHWYFDLLASDKMYAFNIDEDKVTDQWRIWINHKVMLDGNVVGVFCSGLQVKTVLHSMFERYTEQQVIGYVIDNDGFIQMDSVLTEYIEGAEKRSIFDINADPAFIAFFKTYLEGIDGYFGADTQPEVIILSGGEYASVAPLPNSDWTVVTIYDSNTLFSTDDLLPLVLVLVSLFIIYAIASALITRRFVLSPLNSLTVSVSEATETESTIFGDDRDDEIGELARNIEGGWGRLNEAHQRSRLLLDATPMACRLMKRLEDGTFVILECNEEAVRFFNFKNKQDFFDRYFETYPEYQPDGSNSIEKGREYLEIAYNEGTFKTEFIFQTADGTPIPSAVTLVRVKYEDEYVVAGYTRDLREHKQMMDDIEKRDSLLNSINRVAVVLLAAANEKNFEKSLLEGMELIGQCLNADCVQIWPNEMRDGVLHFALKYKWLSETGKAAPDVPVGTALPYTDRWMDMFSRGECIHGPISKLPKEEQELLSPLGLVSTITIPLYYEDKFWGVFCVDDCAIERYFTEGEIGLLNSASLMLVNAINRHAQAELVLEAHNRAKLLLDATPLAVNFWNKDVEIFDCNEEAVRLFKMDNKQEYINRFFDLFPEFQPDGSKSVEVAPFMLGKAFREGKVKFEWMHQLLDGTPIPSEVTLERVVYEDDFAVASYIRDLTEYKRMMQDIHESSVKLEAALQDTQNANNAKSDFLASMSHEMRTPLNAIIGLSDLSLENKMVDRETYTNLEKINNSGEMLLNIVNDILDISKIEAGRMELIEVDYYVPSLINDTLIQNIMRIGDKPIKLKLDIEEDVYERLHGDELRIKQIMNNLLSNAIKYTDKGLATLSFRCEQRYKDKVWITIKVSDTGRGIRTEDLDNLFKDYSQFDLKTNRKTEGTGLGLPITKSLVEMMDGTIEVESEYGKGSVFTVKIAQTIVDDILISPEIAHNLKNFHYSDERRGRNANFKRISMPYAKVLVVDDNATNLDVAKGLMKPYMMQVDCVLSGEEAVEAIREEKVRYSAVFMDHMMPGMDGIEAAHAIRNDIGTEYAKNIPIIALTANAIAGNEDMFLRNGFQAFVSKPIDIARLDKIIRLWVRDKRQEKLIGSKKKEPVSEKAVAADKVDTLSGIKVGGLDIEKGLNRFNGEEDTFLNVLHSYLITTAPLLNVIDMVTEENLGEYAMIVHGIKGSSRGISAEELGAAAETLEKAAKAGDYEYVLEENPAFIKSARALLKGIEETLAQLSPSEPKPKKDRPDEETLKKLLNACKTYDMDEIDALIAELDAYEYEKDEDLVAMLVDSANKYDYSEMKEKLSTLFKKETLK